MSGGKGGSTTSSVQIPSWLEDAAKTNLSKAEYAGNIGYTPYYGPDVAAQTQNQLLGNQATYDAAAAFGLVPQGGNANAGMPTPTTYANGVTGYSSGDLYDQAVAELATRRPGQANALNSMFIDPYSGDAQTIFTPQGSVGVSNAADLNVMNYMSDDITGAPARTPEEMYYGAMQMNELLGDYPVWAPGGLIAKGITSLNDYSMRQFEDNTLGWNNAPSVNYRPTIIDDSGGSSGPTGNEYSVSDVTSGGGFDPSGTSGGNYSGTNVGGGLVF